MRRWRSSPQPAPPRQPRDCAALEASNAELRALVERYRAALEHYADERNWVREPTLDADWYRWGGGPRAVSGVFRRAWGIAREALLGDEAAALAAREGER